MVVPGKQNYQISSGPTDASANRTSSGKVGGVGEDEILIGLSWHSADHHGVRLAEELAVNPPPLSIARLEASNTWVPSV